MDFQRFQNFQTPTYSFHCVFFFLFQSNITKKKQQQQQKKGLHTYDKTRSIFCPYMLLPFTTGDQVQKQLTK